MAKTTDLILAWLDNNAKMLTDNIVAEYVKSMSGETDSQISSAEENRLKLIEEVKGNISTGNGVERFDLYDPRDNRVASPDEAVRYAKKFLCYLEGWKPLPPPDIREYSYRTVLMDSIKTGDDSTGENIDIDFRIDLVRNFPEISKFIIDDEFLCNIIFSDDEYNLLEWQSNIFQETFLFDVCTTVSLAYVLKRFRKLENTLPDADWSYYVVSPDGRFSENLINNGIGFVEYISNTEVNVSHPGFVDYRNIVPKQDF